MSILHPANVREQAELASCAQAVLRTILARDPEARKVFPQPDLAKLRAMSLPAEGRPAAEVAREMESTIFAQQATVDHRRYFAFIPGPFSPLSWIGASVIPSVNGSCDSKPTRTNPVIGAPS